MKKNNPKILFGVIALLGLVFILTVFARTPEFVSAFVEHYNRRLPKEDMINIGTFGDQFGALNALFSGLAFFIIFLSLWTQRDEFRLQRKELKMARQEHERQNFEAQYMFLLKNLNEQIQIVSGEFFLPASAGMVIVRDRDNYGYKYFDQLHKEMMQLHNEVLSDTTDTRELMSYYKWLDLDSIEKYREHHKTNFSSQLFLKIENKRKVEYFHYYRSYMVVIEVLRNHLDSQLKDIDIEHAQLERDFKVYTDLLRSSVPIPALLIFLYINLRPKGITKRDYITYLLYKDFMSAEFLEFEHYQELFKYKVLVDGKLEENNFTESEEGLT